MALGETISSFTVFTVEVKFADLAVELTVVLLHELHLLYSNQFRVALPTKILLDCNLPFLATWNKVWFVGQ